MSIHPTSIVSSEAIIEDGVEIGPYCIVQGRVRIGAGTRLLNHVTIGSENGIVEVGKDNVFYSGAAVGGPPQDKKYKGEDTKLIVGDGNQFRECVTLSLGTVTGGGTTKIGNDNLIMAYSHFGHDSSAGNSNVIANSTQLAGHVSIENNVIVGGMCAINQFARLGNFSFIGGYSAINKDILPFSIAQGNYAVVRATNKVGLERAGFVKGEVDSLHKAIRIITKGNATLPERLERIEEECKSSEQLEYLLNFVRTSTRGLAI